MKNYTQSAANLEAAMHAFPIGSIHTGKMCSETYHHAVLTDEREHFELICAIDSSWETITFRMILPVVYSSETTSELSRYIDKVNHLYSSRGCFSLFDENTMAIEKEIFFSRFVISTDLILSILFSMKANAFDFIEAFRSIGQGMDVADDNGIAAALYYEMYPEKRVMNPNEDIDEKEKEEPDDNLDFALDELIGMIGSDRSGKDGAIQ